MISDLMKSMTQRVSRQINMLFEEKCCTNLTHEPEISSDPSYLTLTDEVGQRRRMDAKMRKRKNEPFVSVPRGGKEEREREKCGRAKRASEEGKPR